MPLYLENITGRFPVRRMTGATTVSTYQPAAAWRWRRADSFFINYFAYIAGLIAADSIHFLLPQKSQKLRGFYACEFCAASRPFQLRNFGSLFLASTREICGFNFPFRVGRLLSVFAAAEKKSAIRNRQS
jgi:hypothetical protein